MPFSLTVGTSTYNPRGNGVSSSSAVTFADPQDYFRFRPGSMRNNLISAGCTRVKEKDVTVSGVTQRVSAQVSLNISVPKNGSFTQTEIDALIESLSTALTPDVVGRLLQGES